MPATCHETTNSTTYINRRTVQTTQLVTNLVAYACHEFRVVPQLSTTSRTHTTVRVAEKWEAELFVARLHELVGGHITEGKVRAVRHGTQVRVHIYPSKF